MFLATADVLVRDDGIPPDITTGDHHPVTNGEPVSSVDDSLAANTGFDLIADLFASAAEFLVLDDSVASEKVLAANVVPPACNLSNGIEEDEEVVFIPFVAPSHSFSYVFEEDTVMLAPDAESYQVGVAMEVVIEEDTVMAAPAYDLYQVGEAMDVDNWGFEPMNIAWLL